MGARLALTLVAAILAMAAFAPSASAQQVGPGGPNAQVGEYVGPTQEIDPTGSGGEANNPSLAGGGPTGEVGASGKLPFTGLWLVPLAVLGITLALVAVAVRRRNDPSAAAA